MQGKLIVFEGGEGSGKTTQVARLQEWLQHNDLFQTLKQRGTISGVITTREPGGTDLCQHIRRLLLAQPTSEPMQNRTELLLYAADRAQHVEYVLKPELSNGKIVLCDRYIYSTIAYQGYGRGLDRTLIDRLNAIATDGLSSDLTLWLDVDVNVGLARTQQRGSADRMEQSGLEFHQRVRQGFIDLAHANPQNTVKIDASKPQDDVAQQIQTALQHYLSSWYED
jgi:dTMP kinase